MTLLEYASFFLDIVLIVAAVIAYFNRPRIGGQLSQGLRILLIGLMILGMAHFIETAMFDFLVIVDRPTNEIIHRLLVGGGFVFVIWGFVKMRRAFEK